MKLTKCHLKIIIKNIYDYIVNFIQKYFIFIVILLLLIARYFPNSYIIIKIEEPNFISNILSIIIGSLASILGIIVAILLVSFEILRQTYSHYALHGLFEYENLKFLFSLFITSIIVSVIALVTLEDPLKIYNFNLLYLSIILFGICLIILYPIVRKCLDITRSKKKIMDMIESINYLHIMNYLQISRTRIHGERVASIEKNPIYILNEVVTRSIDNKDSAIPEMILIKSTDVLLNLIKNNSEYDIRDLINGFLIIIKNSAFQAIRNESVNILRLVIIQIRRIHVFCAKSRFYWSNLVELNDIFLDILHKTIEANLTDSAKNNFILLEDILFNQLIYNVPNENDLFWFQERIQRKKIEEDEQESIKRDNQWHTVSLEYLGMFFSCIDKALELKNGNIALYGIYILNSLVSKIEKSSLGSKQKKQLLRDCYYHISSYIITAKKNDLLSKHNIGFISLSFNYDTILSILNKRDQEYSKIPLLYFCGTLIALAQEQFFDESIQNNLGALGRSLIDKVNENNLFLGALILICNTFYKIYEQVKLSELEEGSKILDEIFKQVDSLKRWMKDKNVKNKILEDKINKILEELKTATKVRNNKDNLIIEWPEIK